MRAGCGFEAQGMPACRSRQRACVEVYYHLGTRSRGAREARSWRRQGGRKVWAPLKVWKVQEAWQGGTEATNPGQLARSGMIQQPANPPPLPHPGWRILEVAEGSRALGSQGDWRGDRARCLPSSRIGRLQAGGVQSITISSGFGACCGVGASRYASSEFVCVFVRVCVSCHMCYMCVQVCA